MQPCSVLVRNNANVALHCRSGGIDRVQWKGNEVSKANCRVSCRVDTDNKRRRAHVFEPIRCTLPRDSGKNVIGNGKMEFVLENYKGERPRICISIRIVSVYGSSQGIPLKFSVRWWDKVCMLLVLIRYAIFYHSERVKVVKRAGTRF